MIDLDKLEVLAKAATPGLWERNRAFGLLNVQDAKYMLGDADAIFISAASPTTVLELIALVRELAVVSIPVIKEGAKIEGGAPVVPDSELPELPDPLEINWPELHSHALGCGVEDRNIHDRYEAAEYGWQDGVDKTMESVPDAIYDADMMREYGAACFAAGRATAPVVDAVPEGWKLVPEVPTAAMAKAGAEHTTKDSADDDEPASMHEALGRAVLAYASMVEAAPTPQNKE